MRTQFTCRRAFERGADALVTRNARDFKGAPVVTRSAGEVLALLAASSSDPRTTE